tara:strand:- start:186 stop:305 length:120 start_codon:yes stop_codon:yes gene_type:complete
MPSRKSADKIVVKKYFIIIILVIVEVEASVNPCLPAVHY